MLVDDLYALSGAGGQLPSGADGPPAPLSASGGQTVPDALSFRCCMCLLEFDEPCSCCGAVLKYDERGPKALSGRGAALKEEL